MGSGNPRKRVLCPHCGRDVAVHANGRLSRHYDDERGAPWGRRCIASSEPAQSTRGET